MIVIAVINQPMSAGGTAMQHAAGHSDTGVDNLLCDCGGP